MASSPRRSVFPPSRREFGAMLIGAGAAAALGSRAQAEAMCRDAAPAPAYQRREPTSLGEIGPNIAWGTHLEGAGVYDEALIAAIAGEKPKVLVVGSALKFGNLHPLSLAFERQAGEKRVSTWAELDDLARLAQRLGAKTRGDAMIWNDWLPKWVSDLAQKRPEGWRQKLVDSFERNFAAVFAHLDELDARSGAPVMPWRGLVNEPFAYWSESGGRPAWRHGAWLDAFDVMSDGVPGYIHKAFEYGEKYSGASKPALYLNEANCENDKYGAPLRAAMLSLLDSLQSAGRKVDAIGLEAHLQPEWMDDPLRPSWRPFVDFLKELQQRGVKIYITELDVNDCLASDDLEQRDRLVADYTYSFTAAALEVPAVTMVTNWDFADSASWYRGGETYRALARWPRCRTRPACPRPTIYDQDLAPKPARDALARAFAGRGTPVRPATSD